MEAVLGDIREDYFRHKSNPCSFDYYLHSTAEEVFFEEYTECLEKGKPFEVTVYPEIQCNPECSFGKKESCSKRYKEKTVIDLTLKYKKITPETRVYQEGRYRRPDLLLESESGEKLWVEIWVSHETDEEKRKLESIIEIKITSQDDIDKIRTHQLIQAGPSDKSLRYFGWKEICSDLQLPRPALDVAYPLNLSSLRELPAQVIPYWKRETAVSWVNLGLPSGTLWSKEYMGSMSFEEAQREFPNLIPSIEQYQELVSSCETTGLFPAGFIGPNGALLEMYEGDFWTNRLVDEKHAVVLHREYLHDYIPRHKPSELEGSTFAKSDTSMRLCVRLAKKIK